MTYASQVSGVTTSPNRRGLMLCHAARQNGGTRQMSSPGSSLASHRRFCSARVPSSKGDCEHLMARFRSSDTDVDSLAAHLQVKAPDRGIADGRNCFVKCEDRDTALVAAGAKRNHSRYAGKHGPALEYPGERTARLEGARGPRGRDEANAPAGTVR